MTEKDGEPIAFFLVTKFDFVCPDCLPKDEKQILTFYDKEDIIGYYNDLHIGFYLRAHENAKEGAPLVVWCTHCNKALAEGSVTHELSDIFIE